MDKSLKISVILFQLAIIVLGIAARTPSQDGNNRSNKPCSLSPLKLEDPINDLVLRIIHELQSHMRDGIPSMGIPPLDPLNISKYNFDVNEPKYKFKAYGKLRDVLVKNLSTFNVTNISTHLLRRSVNVTISIPDLSIQGLYTLKGKALSFFPISGSGPFTLSPKGSSATAFATLSYSGGHFFLSSFDYKVSILDLYAEFDGIYGGGLIGDLLNKILNKFGVSLFARLEPLVHEDIRRMLEVDIDRILKELKVGDVMDGVGAMASRALCIFQ